MKKKEQYIAAIREIEIRLETGGDLIADLGNVTAVLKKRLSFFWVGFYFVNKAHLVLGPFQGAPACVFLPYGKGVCSTCAEQEETLIVPDVEQFPGHIPCDSRTKSEIVVPFYDRKGVLRGVLDVDGDRLDAFDEIDRMHLEKIEKVIRVCW